MFKASGVLQREHTAAVHGLDNIEREQWRKVWPRIRGFTFEPRPEVRMEGDTAWIAAGWRSEATGPDGRSFHSHISLQPTQSESAHGRPGA
jgi:hypothetical protein